MDNDIITIPEENIYLEFCLNNQMYAVISKTTELSEESEVYFAKEDYDENIKIMRNIEDEDEYNKVLKEYERIINEYMEEDEDE